MYVYIKDSEIKSSEIFIELPNDKKDVHSNINDYNQEKAKVFIVFDDMIVDMLNNKKLKLNISLVFITESYFCVPKIIALNSSHYFTVKIVNKLQLMSINLLADIDHKSVMKIYKIYNVEPYFFIAGDTTLSSEN